jgi:hypothetical protein
MNTPQFNNNVLPVLLGTTRLPELAEHQILIRHVIHDIESGQLSRAIHTLGKADAVFELGPLSDLSRFIDAHGEAISAEVKTTAWRDVVSVINRPTQRWMGLTEEQSTAQLMKTCLAITPVKLASAAPYYEPSVKLNREPSKLKEQEPEAQPATLQVSTQPQVQTTPRGFHVRKRVNLRVAFDTFVVTLLLAVLVGWMLK